MPSEDLHRLLRKAYGDDVFKVKIMTEIRTAMKEFNLSSREKFYVKNLAWSLDYFSNIKLTKTQVKKIRERIDKVKNRSSDDNENEDEQLPDIEIEG